MQTQQLKEGLCIKTTRRFLWLQSLRPTAQKRGYSHLEPFAVKPSKPTSLPTNEGKRTKKPNLCVCVCVCWVRPWDAGQLCSEAWQLCDSRKVLLLCLLVQPTRCTLQGTALGWSPISLPSLSKLWFWFQTHQNKSGFPVKASHLTLCLWLSVENRTKLQLLMFGTADKQGGLHSDVLSEALCDGSQTFNVSEFTFHTESQWGPTRDVGNHKKKELSCSRPTFLFLLWGIFLSLCTLCFKGRIVLRHDCGNKVQSIHCYQRCVLWWQHYFFLIIHYFAKQKTYKTEGAIYTVSLRFTQREPTSKAVSHANVPCFVRLLSQRNREVVIVAAPRPIPHMGVDAAIPLPYNVSTVTCTTLREGERDKHTHRYAFCPKFTHWRHQIYDKYEDVWITVEKS